MTEKQGAGERAASPALTPEYIIQTGLGFMASKTLLSAVELGVFTTLAGRPTEGAALARQLGLHPRSARDFLDALVALGLLQRAGQIYSNTPETDYFLDSAKPTYLGGMLEMANARLYGFWGSLTEALQTGKVQNEAKAGGAPFFEALYSDPERLRGFLQAMTGLSMAAALAIARKFDWKRCKTFADVGGAQGNVAVQVALAQPHVNGIVFDLPAVRPVCEEYVRNFTLQDRLRFVEGDFFRDALPKVDVIIMGHILHDWSLEEKRVLISRVYEALPQGGAFIIHEALIDDERSSNAVGLLMSLNMLIETPGGFDYTGADGCGWLRDAGFRETRVEHLVGPDSMIVGIK